MPQQCKILFFCINGSGLGHMNRCLAYARQLKGKAEVSFFSLASAVEIIESFGFPADYFISPFWSDNTSYIWNSELAIRFGMILEQVQPDVIVFDGTWPFQGFLAACRAYGKGKLVWSKRGLIKNEESLSVDARIFDLVLRPGELGDGYQKQIADAMLDIAMRAFYPQMLPVSSRVEFAVCHGAFFRIF